MTYGDPPQRRDLFHGLRMLADLLSRACAYHDAWASYSGSVIPDTPEEG